MIELEEWEHHVKKSGGAGEPMVAYCGEVFYMGFHLTDIEHAKACIEQDTYVQPCPECMKVIENLNKEV